MEKTYQPEAIEPHWAHYWESNHLFEPTGQGTPYCIMLPPPNVTGTLHMGHGFQHTLMDALIRYHRMQGNDVLWQAGTDHAGIATQMVVERQLALQNLSRHDLGREEFLKRMWDWRHQSGQVITQQIRRMGASIAWSRESFMLDDNICRATTEAFIRLFEEGLIYRGQRLVNWDPQLHTAISDLEVSNVIKKGKLWHIRYPITNSNESLVIATTRPETMLGDTAVAVHPNDERYQHLIGTCITLPLVDRQIPIIADESVDKDFGTGCVKITPAHDFNDYAMGQRHILPMISIFNHCAFTNENVPEPFQNLDRFVARKKVLSELNKLKLIVKIDEHEHAIPHGDRSGAIIEPLLTDQWFMKMGDLAKEAIQVVNNGKLKFIPEQWTNTYRQWLENIQDWCISRQLWWGHRIPVWYDPEGNYYVGHHEKDVRKRHQLAEDLPLAQDDDVLDTWFSAALWPFSTLGWPDHTEELARFYPTDVLVTGFDIIFFWVARMVMLGLKLMGDVPFKEVYITGLIRDAQGQKMSKTKGNIIDPIDLIDGIDLESLIAKRLKGLMQPHMAASIEKNTRQLFPKGMSGYGTDALRFTYCALASHGRDINFDMGRIGGYRNFCNKLWNAARFVLMNTENFSLESKHDDLTWVDHWITSCLQHTLHKVAQAFAQYRFDLIAQYLYEFVWNEYCDWYLELAKCEQTNGTRYTLLSVLETTLRLMHPIMPYITEEIWQTVSKRLGIQGNSIMTQPYPPSNKKIVNQDAEHIITWLKQIISAIRNLRGEMNISPALKINVVLNKGDDKDRKYITQFEKHINQLAKIKNIDWKTQAPENSASTLANQLEIYIPLEGLIDTQTEKARLQKEISKLEKDYERSKTKLANENYLAKAPKAVVVKEREKLAEMESALTKLCDYLNRVKKI